MDTVTIGVEVYFVEGRGPIWTLRNCRTDEIVHTRGPGTKIIDNGPSNMHYPAVVAERMDTQCTS